MPFRHDCRSRPILLLLTLLTLTGARVNGNVLDRVADDSFADLMHGIEYRLVGPMRGGRVNRVAGIAGEPNTYFFGAAAGGIWKSGDAGVNWKPVFDDMGVGPIGDFALAPSNPDIIYVGTGDSNPRGNVSHGNGVYRSDDGGQTWRHLGLEDTRHIGRVVIHPDDPDTVYVAALGHLFGPNEERGIYRSRDGGRNWSRVLFGNADTGAYDIALVPGDPNLIFATTWQVRRKPHDLVSGGPGSGLFRSTDGGDSWVRLRGNGLPEGVMGKVGVAVSPADPDRVYALIEARAGGLYRSDDGGESWRHVNGSRLLWQRAWFFMDIVPDPVDVDTVYVMNINLLRSTDGGDTFETMNAHHVDHHDLWIDPQNPRRMISGNDGGANVSVNGGKTWTHSDDNQPTGQFYRVATDERTPYFIYGGQQDWEVIAVTSRGNWNGIGYRDWYPVGGCEMGWAAPDRRTHNFVYAGCTDGGVSRYDRRTERSTSIDPWPRTNLGNAAADARFRFQWTSPMLISPHDPGTLYLGSNMLLKTTDDGRSWSRISPDLSHDDESKQAAAGGPITRDNVGTEVYGTIFALAESPLKRGLLWAGTDDGRVHVTRDGGTEWLEVSPPSSLLPRWSKINSIEASAHHRGTAYVVAHRRDHDDYRPFVLRTRDYGERWDLVTAGLPGDSLTRVLREDTERSGVLFLGTERGVHVSFNHGNRWFPLQLNLPSTPVYDMTIRQGDLVVATHGRGFWVLDQLQPLRELPDLPAGVTEHLFEPQQTIRFRDDFVTPTRSVGQNPPPGVIIDYWLDGAQASDLRIEIRDAGGEPVRVFTPEDSVAVAQSKAKRHGHPGSEGKLAWDADATLTIETTRFPDAAGSDTGAAYNRSTLPSTTMGVNRFIWDLRYPGARTIPGRVAFWHRPKTPPVGPLAPPGEYEVRLYRDGRVRSERFVVEADPRLNYPVEELQQQFELHISIRDTLSDVSELVLEIRALREQLRSDGPVPERRARLVDGLTELELTLTEPRMEGPADAFHLGTKLDNRLGLLMGTVANSDRAPTTQSRAVYDELLKELSAAEVTFGALRASAAALLSGE